MSKKITSIRTRKSHTMPASGHRPSSAITNLTMVGAVWLALVAAGCTRDPGSTAPASATPSAAPAPQAPTGQAKATVYKCPMHPDVTSDKPGKCSVCGMNLEKVP